MILLFPSLVHLKTDEDRANFKPRYFANRLLPSRNDGDFNKSMLTHYRCHMFYGQRVMDIPDGLPKWSGLSNDSDLIEDSPQEAVQEFERNREQMRKEKEEKQKKEEEEKKK